MPARVTALGRLGRFAVMAGQTLVDMLGRLARHWFMLGLLYGGMCLTVWGYLFLDFGVAFLFREDRPIAGIGLASLLQSPCFFTGLLGMMLAGAVWLFAVHLDPREAQDESLHFALQLPVMAAHVAVLGVPLVLAMLYPSSPAVPTLTRGEIGRLALGCGLGFALNFMVLSLAWLIEEGIAHLYKRHLGFRSWLERQRIPLHRLIAWDNFNWRVIILWAMYALAWTTIINTALGLPAVAIFAIVGVLLAAYVLLNLFREEARLWVLLVTVGLPVLATASEPYRYTFPGLETSYVLCDAMREKIADGTLVPARPLIACSSDHSDEHHQVPRSEPLQALRLSVPPTAGGDPADPRLPKLVVVAISGGAYRAAFWGALVLDRLREESAPGRKLEGLAQSIRLLTGASGGMVPAAYFAMLPHEEIDAPRSAAGKAAQTIERGITADIASANGETLEAGRHDSLSSIAAQLVSGDLFNFVLPWRHEEDRGRTLEKQWRTLDVTFDQLREDEAAGLRPSLIFSPMLAETGQPLLISNLDLSGIDDSGSGETFDLFKEMPEAARHLKLSTAVRMSATFPLVSPTVSLPTIPPRHVLDAGYFDDYGMSMALAYLKQPDVVDWLAQNTAGVIVVQINAYPVATLPDGPIRQPECREAAVSTFDSLLARALEPMVGPLAGLFSARGASMVFRNDQELRLLQARFAQVRTASGAPLALDRVSFENAARASFSWYLPQRDLSCMRLQLAEPHNVKAFDRLVRLWRQ